MTSIDLSSFARPSELPPRTFARRRAAAPSSDKARRALNVAVAGLGLVVAAPLMALIAVAIKLTSRGPVFYTQTRVGIDRRKYLSRNHRRAADLGGQPFRIYKFRTMAVAQADHATERWATKDDPRVTTLGRVLRKYRFDEIPQLLNVLKGEMNVVGPRPEQPTIFTRMREEIPGYACRQRVLPGITGWAQINQHYDTTLKDVRRKAGYDLEYVARQSLTEDLKIMLLTVPTVAFRRGGW